MKKILLFVLLFVCSVNIFALPMYFKSTKYTSNDGHGWIPIVEGVNVDISFDNDKESATFNDVHVYLDSQYRYGFHINSTIKVIKSKSGITTTTFGCLNNNSGYCKIIMITKKSKLLKLKVIHSNLEEVYIIENY